MVALGIAEKTLISDSCGEILRAIGRRAIYTVGEVEALCSRPVLAVSFRQARIFRPEIPLSWLLEHGVLRYAPQYPVRIEREGLEKLLRIL